MKAFFYMTLHLAFCGALFWSVFCRSVAMSKNTKLDVRFSFYMLGVASILGFAAPVAWAFAPTGYTLTLLGAITLVQITTARHWGKGVPHDFLHQP